MNAIDILEIKVNKLIAKVDGLNYQFDDKTSADAEIIKKDICDLLTEYLELAEENNENKEEEEEVE